MEGLSIFMLAVALTLGTAYVASIFISKKVNLSYFRYPMPSVFNIIWGFLFYLLYSILMLRESIWVWAFVFTGVLNLLVIMYFYGLKRILDGMFVPMIIHIINIGIRKQKKLDEKLNVPYSKAKALKILGVNNSQLKSDNAEKMMNHNMQKLNIFADNNKKRLNPYFAEMIKKSYNILMK